MLLLKVTGVWCVRRTSLSLQEAEGWAFTSEQIFPACPTAVAIQPAVGCAWGDVGSGNGK